MTYATGDGVVRCLGDFYAALENASYEAMRGLWEPSPQAVCVHPGHDCLIGYDAIMASWRAIFRGGPSLRVRFELLQRADRDTHSICLVREHLEPLAARGGAQQALATNVVARAAGSEWRLLIHHAALLPAAGSRDDAAQPPARLH